jgi:hypothetical protein
MATFWSSHEKTLARISSSPNGMRDSYHDFPSPASGTHLASGRRSGQVLPSVAEALDRTAENLPMTEVQVTRWRKYGKDRSYVNGRRW